MLASRLTSTSIVLLALEGCLADPAPATQGMENGADGADGTQSDGAPATGDGEDQNPGGDPPPAGGHEGGAFPFPQGRDYPHCKALAADAQQLRAAYEKWRAMAVVSDGAGGMLRVRRWESNDDTVSEGIAYGMLAAVTMNDPATFDALWGYGRLHANANGFMHWRIDATGQDLEYDGRVIGPSARGGATDADEDMAWALVMAHYQWGGSGTVGRPYLELARELIDAIWDHEVDHGAHDVLKPGDRWGGYSTTNPSYFAPAYYRVFADVTDNEGWNRVVDSSYDVLFKAANPTTGLVPAWCTGAGGAAPNMDATYQYDACRTPFRIAFDYCLFGEPRAKRYAELVGAFFQGIGAGRIGDGYALDGSALSFNRSSAFLGPAGAAALTSTTLSGFAGDVYDELLVLGQQTPALGYSYYNYSWGLLSQLFLSGNFHDYSHL